MTKRGARIIPQVIHLRLSGSQTYNLRSMWCIPRLWGKTHTMHSVCEVDLLHSFFLAIIIQSKLLSVKLVQPPWEDVHYEHAVRKRWLGADILRVGSGEFFSWVLSFVDYLPSTLTTGTIAAVIVCKGIVKLIKLALSTRRSWFDASVLDFEC